MGWQSYCTIVDNIYISDFVGHSSLVNLFYKCLKELSTKSRSTRRRHEKTKDIPKLAAKTTAPRIPAWSPTVVLTRRHSG